MCAKVDIAFDSSIGIQRNGMDTKVIEYVEEIKAGLKHDTYETIEELKEKMYNQLTMLQMMVKESTREWSELPNELLELILRMIMPSEFDLMSFKHLLNFKAICHSWRTVARSYSSFYAPLPQTPWLLHYEPGKTKVPLFDPIGKHVYTIESIYIQLSDLTGAKCVGSSYGWMIMFHRDEDSNDPMAHLFNPISKAKIQIPDSLTLYGRYPYPYNIFKGIVSTNPSKNKNYLVIVALKNCAGLAYCKQGDKSWHALDATFGYGYYDILFHGDKLFALKLHRGGENSLEVWDCRESIPMKSMHLQDCAISNNREISANLVVSMAGEILRMRPIGVSAYGPEHYVVEKLNLMDKKWEEIHDLGNQSLFLYYDQLMSLSSPCFLGSERNSIYFAIRGSGTHPSQKIGTYNLKEKTMRGSEDFCSLMGNDNKTLRWPFPPGWIVPNPW